MSKHDTFCGQGKDGQWWDTACDCDFIADVREDQNSRIVKLVTNSQAINPDQKYFLLKAINGEQK